MIPILDHPVVHAAARTVLAAATATPTPLPSSGGDDSGSEAQKSGPLGLVVILVLCVACYFLFRSMSRHMRKVQPPGFGRGGTVSASGSVPTQPSGGSPVSGRPAEIVPTSSAGGRSPSDVIPSAPPPRTIEGRPPTDNAE
jgi:hypothetical protein